MSRHRPIEDLRILRRAIGPPDVYDAKFTIIEGFLTEENGELVSYVEKKKCPLNGNL